MKSDTSMNVLLVAFCAVLLGFVFFSSKIIEANKTAQAQVGAGK